MPNHYTTVGIFAPGYNFDVDQFNEQHKDSCLCSIVRPMPEELIEVHVGVSSRGERYWKVINKEEVPIDVAEMRAKYGECNWYDWANKVWGTKWGTYGVRAFDLEGDSSPVAIKFQSAWSPPKIISEITAWPCKTYGFESHQWLGYNPINGNVELIG